LEKSLIIKRLDDNIGWEQDLVIEYYEKVTKNVKHIKVGPSKENVKSIIININKIEYIEVPNYYDDTIYKIEKIKNQYDDKFIFNVEHKTNILKVKRFDTNEGWGQNLMVKIHYKNTLRFLFHIHQFLDLIHLYIPQIHNLP